jgi:VWFA-related protein
MRRPTLPSRRTALIIILLTACSALIYAGPRASTQSASTQKQSRPRRATSAPPQPAPSPAPAPSPKSSAPPARVEDQTVNDDEVVRVESAEVMLPVTVRDARGQLVATLTREDFRVLEDGREQPLSDLALRKVPVDVALMVDASSSVAASLDDFRQAADEFAARLAPEDRFCLIKFDDRVELVQDWTSNRAQLRRSLRRITTGMFTNFNDALWLMAREQFKAASRRHAAVVLSDGIDSGRGRFRASDALRALLEAQATVYVISNSRIERARKQAELDTLLSGTDSSVRFNQLRIGDLQEGLRVLSLSERNLEQIADATGGRLYTPDSFDALGSVYTEVADELRSQYALYYTPLDTKRDGRFRSVQALTKDQALKVSTRTGYYARTR